MKKTLLTVVLAFIGMATFAQKGTGFGIKGGLNYNQNGDLTYSVGDSGNDIVQGAEGKAGFNVGIFGQLELPIIYLRPELVYTNTKSSYDIDGGSRDYELSSLDLPVLVGIHILGPINIFAGPAFQYVLSNDMDGFEMEDVKNNFTVGLNLGVGINLGRLGLDVRWVRGFSENEANFIDENVTNISGRVDSRPNQVVFSASIKL
ncbi:porin family protein [Flavobacteriaceae bacterium F89]|uniref:Porin family protein n=1 Tax=Cerina litoralis TaxID=2874477 RepID=A0AAE3ESA1_9FLAO|nr:outer membrane beta-barrel protein [Cerina litoralis]MCG2459445.1 porin family protein [Cerina litoralis]